MKRPRSKDVDGCVIESQFIKTRRRQVDGRVAEDPRPSSFHEAINADELPNEFSVLREAIFITKKKSRARVDAVLANEVSVGAAPKHVLRDVVNILKKRQGDRLVLQRQDCRRDVAGNRSFKANISLATLKKCYVDDSGFVFLEAATRTYFIQEADTFVLEKVLQLGIAWTCMAAMKDLFLVDIDFMMSVGTHGMVLKFKSVLLLPTHRVIFFIDKFMVESFVLCDVTDFVIDRTVGSK